MKIWSNIQEILYINFIYPVMIYMFIGPMSLYRATQGVHRLSITAAHARPQGWNSWLPPPGSTTQTPKSNDCHRHLGCRLVVCNSSNHGTTEQNSSFFYKSLEYKLRGGDICHLNWRLHGFISVPIKISGFSYLQ